MPATRRGDLIVQLTKRSNAVSIINRLDASKRTELLSHLGASPQGIRLVDDLGEQGTKSLLELSYESASAKQLRENLFKRYDALEAGSSARQTFARIASDPDLRKSWVRAAGSSVATKESVRQATEWFNKYEGDHTIKRFLTGKRANELDKKATDPHKASSVAMEFAPDSVDTFVRVTSDGRKTGEFLARPDDLKRLDSRSEVMTNSDLTCSERTAVKTDE